MNPEMILALAALVSGVAGIISAILLNRKTVALLEYRMNEVEKRLDKHNHYSEMFSHTTDAIAEIKTDVAVIKKSLEFMTKEADK